MERYAIVPFRSVQANGKHVTGTIAFPSEHKTELAYLQLEFEKLGPNTAFTVLDRKNDIIFLINKAKNHNKAISQTKFL